MRTKKKKFKPVITRVKLNPEQAVLTCNCYIAGKVSGFFFEGFSDYQLCGSKGFSFFSFTNVIGFSSSSS